MGVLWLWAVALCVTCASADRGGSSLRGALEALQRRQRGRVLGPVIPVDYDTIYEVIPPQVYPEPDYPVDLEDIEEEQPKYIVKLLEDEDRPSHAYEYKIVKKQMPQALPGVKESAFRERAQHADNDRLKDLFNNGNEEGKKEVERQKSDAEYALLLGQLWSKYKNTKPHEDSAPQGVVKLYREKVVKKRVPDNWGPIAFKRKRSSGSEDERPILPDYETRKHDLDNENSNYNAYEVSDDDRDDIREEYAIAFQPLEDDSVPDPENEDIYTYDTVEKRFPVSKRSSAPYDFTMQKKRFIQDQSKPQNSKKFRSSSGTDPKLMKDLSRIFGDSGFEVIKNPVKRSSDQEEGSHESKPPNLTILDKNSTHDHRNSTQHKDVSDEHEHGHMHHPGVSGNEVEHGHEHGNEHNHDHAHLHAHDHAHDNKHKDKPIIVRKKSIDWTDYFGIDKRSNKFRNDASEEKLRKQYFDTFNKEVVYPLNSFRVHSNVKRNYVTPKANEESEFEMDNSRAIAIRNEDKKNSDSDAKLDDIDKRLKNMEVLIVDEALHYSNAGEELDSKEEQEMKEKLLSRLAAAYSLEKMRKALKEFKQSLQTHKTHAEQEPARAPVPTDEAKVKRVAVKKEKVDSDNEIPQFKEERSDDFEEEQGAGHYLNGKNEDQFSEGYMGGSGRHRSPVMSTVGAPGSCPVLEKIVQRCRGVDILSGDRGQLFLPLCSLHQTCYLCGEAPPTICDLVFLSEADTACSGDTNCQRVARDALMGLKELHDNLADELDGECEASPCLLATLKLNLGWQHAIKR